MIILLESLPTVQCCVALLATDLTHWSGALFATSILRAIPLLLIVVVAATIVAVVIGVIGAPVSFPR
jgi:Mn2+/Fe2+ NRAMP family transporter